MKFVDLLVLKLENMEEKRVNKLLFFSLLRVISCTMFCGFEKKL